LFMVEVRCSKMSF